MSESSETQIPEKPRPLFEKIVAEEMKEEIKQGFHFDPRMERDMLERNKDTPPQTVRGILLDTVSKEYQEPNAASLVRNLETLSESEQEEEHLKVLVVKGVFTSFYLGESIIKRLAESKGQTEKKIVNEGSWRLAGLLVVARATEWLTTHASKKQKVDSPANTLLKVISKNIPMMSRRKVTGGDIHKPWGEFCELADQNELVYPLRVGNAKDSSANFIDTGDPENTLDHRADVLSDQILAICNSYTDMAQISAENGQPFGYRDNENRRIAWDKDRDLFIPIALAKRIKGEVKAKIVMVRPQDNANSTLAHNKIALEAACRGAMESELDWKDPSEITRALFAINLDKQERLMSNEDTKELLNIGSELRPMGVWSQGEDDLGNVQTEYTANHTVADGMATDLFVNGGKTQKRVRDGTGKTILVTKEYKGIRGYYNEGKSDEQALHTNDEARYNTGEINVERCFNDGENPDVIISRTHIDSEQGSDVLQSAVMIANEIFIDVAKKITKDPIWNDIPIGANNTHSSKDNPFLRLVPASIYRKHADKFNSLPDNYAQYNEVWALLSSLVSYKENRWLIDNYDTTKNEESWNDHTMPASLESMAGITESNLPRWIKKTLFAIQKHEKLKVLRYALTYTQTVVSDKATNGDDFKLADNSSLHKTVNNDGMPGVAIRQEHDKLGIVFSQSRSGTLIPPEYLEAYSLLTTRVLVDTSKLLSDVQAEFKATGKVNLKELNENLQKLKEKNRESTLQEVTRATR